MLSRAGVVLAIALSMILALPALPASAGPQDDPPIDVVSGSGRYLSDAAVSLTLTLDGAAGNGDLEQREVDQAKAAAAAAYAESNAAGGEDGPSGGGGVTDSTSFGGGESDSAPVGECSFRQAILPAGDSRWGGNDPATGTLLVDPCNGPGVFVFVPNPAPGAPGVPAAAASPPPPPPDPAVLAQQAYTELSLPKPEAQRSPDANNFDPAYGSPYTWVGLNTWVWVNNWQPLQRTVDLRGVSATVTATPTSLSFDPGNGDAAVSCPGPGRPWTDADGNQAPTTGGCAYMYRSVTPAGPLTATTGITWSVAWTSNTGAGGTFPALTTATTSSFLVEQIQVVVQR